MERVRPPRSSDDAVPETIGPLPSTQPLDVLLDGVRSPGVLRQDVDELLRGLARPLAEDESPRSRADFLLSVIESHDVGDLLGTAGLTVRAAAVKALLDLGYPYALEVPPEALAEVHGTHEEGAPLKLPIPGLIATLAGFLTQSAQCLLPVFEEMGKPYRPPAWLLLIALAALLGPTSTAVLGGLLRMRGLLKTGLVTMGITGVLWMVIFSTQVFRARHPFQDPFTWVSLVAGLGFLAGALLMLPSAWLGGKEAPEPDETPPTKT